MSLINDTVHYELPEIDTSIVESIGDNTSRFCENSFLAGSEATESDRSYVRRVPIVQTWNGTNGFKRAFTSYVGQAPDYRLKFVTPVNFFYQFCSKKMIEVIQQATNMYAAQKGMYGSDLVSDLSIYYAKAFYNFYMTIYLKGIALNATYQEIEQYIGILLHMGVIQMPDYRMYWAANTRYPPIADVITRRCFDAIKANFHICDNSESNPGLNYDRLFKVRKLYDHVQSACKKLDIPEYLSIG